MIPGFQVSIESCATSQAGKGYVLAQIAMGGRGGSPITNRTGEGPQRWQWRPPPLILAVAVRSSARKPSSPFQESAVIAIFLLYFSRVPYISISVLGQRAIKNITFLPLEATVAVEIFTIECTRRSGAGKGCVWGGRRSCLIEFCIPCCDAPDVERSGFWSRPVCFVLLTDDVLSEC